MAIEQVEGTSARQREILDAAIHLFYRNGYHETGMNDIGEVVGLTGPALYRHFDNKADILETALLRAAGFMERRVGKIIADHPDPAERLRALVKDLIDVLLADPKIVSIAQTERRYLSDRAREIYDASARTRTAEWVAPLLELRDDLTPKTAELVVSLAQGVVRQAVRPPAGTPVDEVRRQLFEVIEAALFSHLDRPVPQARDRIEFDDE